MPSKSKTTFECTECGTTYLRSAGTVRSMSGVEYLRTNHNRSNQKICSRILPLMSLLAHWLMLKEPHTVRFQSGI